MPYITTDAVQLLQHLVVEVAELRRLLLDQRRGALVGADAALLHTVFAVAGHREFSSADLIQMSARPGVPESALRAMLGRRSPKSVGKMLSSIAGMATAETGLLLTGTEGHNRMTWRVSQAHKPAPR